MQDRNKSVLLKLNDLYLCPGDEEGPHVTDSSTMCPCGNSNLASLARILDRETTSVSMLEILHEEHPEFREKVQVLFKDS